MTQMVNYFFSTLAHVFHSAFPEYREESMEKTPSFGAEQWKNYGLTVKEPEIPNDLQESLKACCPFWSDHIVAQTHFLCLIPKGLSYDELINLTDSKALKTTHFDEGEWILITKRVVPKTSSLPHQTQLQILSKEGYTVPYKLEAALAVLAAAHYNVSAFTNRETATRCQEMSNSSYIAIGMDSAQRVCAYGNNWDMHHGVAGVKRSSN